MLMYAEVAALFKMLDNHNKVICTPVSLLQLYQKYLKKYRVYSCHHILNLYSQNFYPVLDLYLAAKPYC